MSDELAKKTDPKDYPEGVEIDALPHSRQNFLTPQLDRFANVGAERDAERDLLEAAACGEREKR